MNKRFAFNAMKNNNSSLCVGLDLTGDGKLERALEIIDITQDLAAAYKPNRQYWLGSTTDEIKLLTSRISKFNCISIIDHKLSDIGSTNETALIQASMENFDFMTVSPFPGNMEENSGFAKKLKIGLISLVLMSNPQATWMIESNMYKTWAREAENYCSGLVVGTTNHVTSKEMEIVAEASPSTFVLAPGLGKQGGDPSKLRSVFGDRLLFNVSRGISQANDIRDAAEHYYKISTSQ